MRACECMCVCVCVCVCVCACVREEILIYCDVGDKNSVLHYGADTWDWWSVSWTGFNILEVIWQIWYGLVSCFEMRWLGHVAETKKRQQKLLFGWLPQKRPAASSVGETRPIRSVVCL